MDLISVNSGDVVEGLAGIDCDKINDCKIAEGRGEYEDDRDVATIFIVYACYKGLWVNFHSFLFSFLIKFLSCSTIIFRISLLQYNDTFCWKEIDKSV